MRKAQLIKNSIIGILALVTLLALVYFMLSTPRGEGSGVRCQRVDIHIEARGGGEPLFLPPEGVLDELTHHGVLLKGKRLDSIDLRRVERVLRAVPVYERVEAFVSPASASVQIRLREKHPLFIVQDRKGQSHYVTEGRGTIPVRVGFATYLPIASGDLDLPYATTAVYDLVETLRRDSYFADYFGQIYVDATQGVILIPRVGTTRVIMGKSPNWAEKLHKWRLFSEAVLPKRGLNAFAYVNLDYEGQVVARDRHGIQGFARDEDGELVRLGSDGAHPQPSTAPAPTSPREVSPAPQERHPRNPKGGTPVTSREVSPKPPSTSPKKPSKPTPKPAPEARPKPKKGTTSTPTPARGNKKPESTKQKTNQTKKK